MQLSLFLLAMLSATSATAQQDSLRTDYFFRFIGGNPTIHNLRLRSNSSSSPGVTRSPQDPKDHFKRISIYSAEPSLLKVVPTHPHPPPVPGYYGLSSTSSIASNGDDNTNTNITDAFRLTWSFHPDEDPGFRYRDWNVHRSVRDPEKILLRYNMDRNGNGKGGRDGDADQEWRWIAVKEKANPDAEVVHDIWVPWYVRPGKGNMQTLSKWKYDVVDLELVSTNGAVNSGAPGGVEE